MRFAMAAELAGLLSDCPRRGAPARPWRPGPTITPVGMAALLPGAENGFCLVDDQGQTGRPGGRDPLWPIWPAA